MIRQLKAFAMAVLTAIGAVLFIMLRRVRNQRDRAQTLATRERETREAVTDAQTRKRKIDDDVRATDADDRRERLRKYASGSGRDD